VLLHLFSSRTRVKLLSIFLLNQEKHYFIRELTRLTTEQINSVRRELENLESIGVLVSQHKNNKKFYSTDKECLVIEELSSLFLKLSDNKYEIVQGISQHGDIDLLAMTTTLNKQTKELFQLIIVGKIKDKKKINEFIENLEKKNKKEVQYFILKTSDFTFRHRCNDKFLTDFFLKHPIVLIDKLKYSW